MNKQRREEIESIKRDIDIIKGNLQKVLDEEQVSFDNMPEGLQFSERGMNSENSIDIMEDTLDILDDAINNLNSIY